MPEALEPQVKGRVLAPPIPADTVDFCHKVRHRDEKVAAGFEHLPHTVIVTCCVLSECPAA